MDKATMNFGFIFQIIGLIILVIGLGFSFLEKKPTIFSYINKIQNIFTDIKGDDYFAKPRIVLKPFTINITNPNPDIGYDSDYILEIIARNTITSFSFKLKLPKSVVAEIPVSLFNDDNSGQRAWYDPELENGYALFNVRNAGGTYHLVLAHKKIEEVTMDDITW